ncbi:hypothetical protein VNO80_18347 [Phaseolus coccineus]|uniref:Uncharacterized protein n=1 Tax=Phaseolus coccineus TaxID=3886 RepID=A0AAN9MF74_PHACN
MLILSGKTAPPVFCDHRILVKPSPLGFQKHFSHTLNSTLVSDSILIAHLHHDHAGGRLRSIVTCQNSDSR